MSIRRQAGRQYQAKVAAAHAALEGPIRLAPPEGWIATVRKALGMSGTQLARRIGVTRARVSQADRAESDGGVTLKSMRGMAEAMGCTFVCQPASNFDQQPAPNIDQGLPGYFRFLNR